MAPGVTRRTDETRRIARSNDATAPTPLASAVATQEGLREVQPITS